MSYEFKRLGEVNALGEMKEGLNVLAVDGSDVVKISSDAMFEESKAMFEESNAKLSEVESRIQTLEYNINNNMVEKVLFEIPVFDAANNYEGTDRYAVIMRPADFSLEAGRAYTVYLNGVVYKCIAFETVFESLSGNPIVIIGNAGLDSVHGKEDTGEPFAFIAFNNMAALGIERTLGSEVNVKITTMEEKSEGGANIIIHPETDNMSDYYYLGFYNEANNTPVTNEMVQQAMAEGAVFVSRNEHFTNIISCYRNGADQPLYMACFMDCGPSIKSFVIYDDEYPNNTPT